MPDAYAGSATVKPTPKPAAKKAAPRVVPAPADEYFGRLKMSILGIQNTLKDLALKASFDPPNSENIFNSATFAEEALHEWEHKYPTDPWLAKTVGELVHMYAQVPTVNGRLKMHAAMLWLQKHYAATKSIIAAAKAEVDRADQTPLLTAGAQSLSAPSIPQPVAPAPGAPAQIAPAGLNPPATAAPNSPAPAPSPSATVH